MAVDDSTPNKVFFKTIKEVRGNYLVEYLPPRDERPHGSISLSCISPATDHEVIRAMEAELAVWMRRFPYPTLVSASDPAGDFLKFESLKPSPFLIGVWKPDGSVVTRWGWFEEGEEPKPPLNVGYLLRVFSGVPYTTPAQITVEMKKTALGFRILKWILVLIYVVVPITILILGVTNPIVGWTTFGVSLLALIKKLLELLGHWKPSARARAKAEEQQRLRHYQYHCERNPDGFSRLVAENLGREIRADFEKEVAALTDKKA